MKDDGSQITLPHADLLREITLGVQEWQRMHPEEEVVPPELWTLEEVPDGRTAGLQGRLYEAVMDGRASARVFSFTTDVNGDVLYGLHKTYSNAGQWLEDVRKSGLTPEMFDQAPVKIGRYFLSQGYSVWINAWLPFRPVLEVGWLADEPLLPPHYLVTPELITQAEQNLLTDDGPAEDDTKQEGEPGMGDVKSKARVSIGGKRVAELIWPHLPEKGFGRLNLPDIVRQLGPGVSLEDVERMLDNLTQAGVITRRNDVEPAEYRRGNPSLAVYQRARDDQPVMFVDLNEQRRRSADSVEQAATNQRSPLSTVSSGVSQSATATPSTVQPNNGVQREDSEMKTAEPKLASLHLVVVVSVHLAKVARLVWPQLKDGEYVRIDQATLQTALGVSQSVISHHLGNLVEVGVIERQGQSTATTYRRGCAHLDVRARSDSPHTIEIVDLNGLVPVPKETDQPTPPAEQTELDEPPKPVEPVVEESDVHAVTAQLTQIEQALADLDERKKVLQTEAARLIGLQARLWRQRFGV